MNVMTMKKTTTAPKSAKKEPAAKKHVAPKGKKVATMAAPKKEAEATPAAPVAPVVAPPAPPPAPAAPVKELSKVEKAAQRRITPGTPLKEYRIVKSNRVGLRGFLVQGGEYRPGPRGNQFFCASEDYFPNLDKAKEGKEKAELARKAS